MLNNIISHLRLSIYSTCNKNHETINRLLGFTVYSHFFTITTQNQETNNEPKYYMHAPVYEVYKIYVVLKLYVEETPHMQMLKPKTFQSQDNFFCEQKSR